MIISLMINENAFYIKQRKHEKINGNMSTFRMIFTNCTLFITGKRIYVPMLMVRSFYKCQNVGIRTVQHIYFGEIKVM